MSEEESTTDYLVNCRNSICVPLHRTSRDEKVEVKKKDRFDFNSALENVYPLTDIICGYLPFSALLNISEISEIWRASATKEITRRKEASWIMLCKSSTSSFGCFKSDNYELVQKSNALFFYNYKKLKLNQYICVHRKVGLHRKRFYEHILDDILEDNKIQFACISLHSMYSFSPPNKEPSPYYSGVFLPDIPNIRIRQFYYWADRKRNENQFDDIIKENEKLECLLVFGTKNPLVILGNLVKDLEKKNNVDLSLGGGLVWGIKSCNVESRKVIRSADLYCLGFFTNDTAESNFYSASVVIPESVFEEELNKFKQKVVFREKSIIFRFCCLAKDDCDIEDPLLRKLFPNALLLQLDVNGEIGYNRYPNQHAEGDSPTKKSRLMFNYYHEYSTILIYVTWGKIVSKN